MFSSPFFLQQVAPEVSNRPVASSSCNAEIKPDGVSKKHGIAIHTLISLMRIEYFTHILFVGITEMQQPKGK